MNSSAKSKRTDVDGAVNRNSPKCRPRQRRDGLDNLNTSGGTATIHGSVLVKASGPDHVCHRDCGDPFFFLTRRTHAGRIEITGVARRNLALDIGGRP